ncbi:MAG TPA: CehA/McbA family metallohydrolase [Thermoanaerobaculia bacterium]|nr:CehA/McbA family metallohydrolase [Thermoanaerobaculia bacterium]
MRARLPGAPWRAALAAALLLACRSEPQAEAPAPVVATAPGVPGPPETSPSARLEVAASLRRDLETERHPTDGGGRAWLVAEASDAPARAGARGRWTVEYEAQGAGIAAGGALFFQTSPFWGWSTPQVRDPEAAGFTRLLPEPAELAHRAETVDQNLLAIRLPDGMAAGQRLRIVFGAGPAGAAADDYAERGSPFWLAVDGDGDGIRRLVPSPPRVDVAAGPPARLVATLPSTARPGEPLRLALAVLDARGSAGVEVAGELRLTSVPAGLDLPAAVTVRRADGGVLSLQLVAPAAGVYRVRAEGLDGLAAESNPLVVGEGRRILWGDLHGHSQLSDGTGAPEEYFRYARDVAALDLAALTDHDHWGMQPLATHPRLWSAIREQVAAFHQPHRFVSLLGYEWTSWVHGHRHVLYFGDEGDVLSSVDPRYEHPRQLWDALRGLPALTLAHHSAGGPVATNWGVPPDPELEPVTEIVSVHGSSEAPDAPAPIYSPVAGNFVRDALGLGYRLGFIGSGDGHDGHPGHAHLGAASGGLAAILSEVLTRDAVLAALRARRVYATNGPRILLRAALAGQPMGSQVAAAQLQARPRLELQVAAPAAVERVDLVRQQGVWQSLPLGAETVLQLSVPVGELRPGELIYVRVVQEDGGAAWSSPWWIVD